MGHTDYDGEIQQRFQAMLEGLEQAGLSKGEMARRLCTSRQQLWRLETGAIRNPSFALGERIMKLHQQEVTK